MKRNNIDQFGAGIIFASFFMAICSWYFDSSEVWSGLGLAVVGVLVWCLPSNPHKAKELSKNERNEKGI